MDKIIIKYLVCLITIGLPLFATAQELTDMSIIPEEGDIELTNRLIQDDGRYFIKIRGDDIRDYLDLDFENHPDGVTWLQNGEIESRRYDYILEYVPSEGIVDYTSYYMGTTEAHAVDGNRLALASESGRGFIDGHQIFGTPHTVETEDTFYQALVVYDFEQDSVLWKLDNIGSWVRRYEHRGIGLVGDHLYVSISSYWEHVFMGDSIKHISGPDPQLTTTLHKINWKTNTKEWSKNIGSCEVEQFRELVDGSIMLDISLHAHFIWEGVPMESSDWGSANRSKVYVKMSSNGDYINHVRINSLGTYNAFRFSHISDAGQVSVAGNVLKDSRIKLINDTIHVDRGTVGIVPGFETTGVLFIFDENLNYKWHKLYESPHASLSLASNITIDGNHLVCMGHMGDVTIEDEIIENEYEDWEFEGQTLILEYDENGNLISKPFYLGPEFYSYDIIKTKDEINEFVLFGKVSRSNVQLEFFLGVDINSDFDDYNVFMTVEGSFLENIVSVHDRFESSDILVSPNPCASLDLVTVDLSAIDNLDRDNLTYKIYDVNGQLLLEQKLKGIAEKIELDAALLPCGPLYIVISDSLNIYSTKIIKAN